MKSIAHASHAQARRTFLDRNRIVKVTDRRFHCAWEELRGARAWITPTVARECLVGDAEHLDDMRRTATAVVEEDGLTTLRGRDAAQRLWWMDQWTTEHGIIGLATLAPEQESIRDRLLATMPPRYFNCESQAELDDSSDARLVAEVVALDEDVLLSSNFNTVEVKELNQWLHEHVQDDGRPTSDGPVHLVDNYLKESIETGHQGADLAMRTILGAFWPEVHECSQEDVLANALQATGRFQSPGGHLKLTGAYLQARLVSPDWQPWIAKTIEDLRTNGAERVQQAERRHPKHRAWEKKPYRDNTPKLARALHEARLRWPDGAMRYSIDAQTPAYGLNWLTKPGGDVIPLGTAKDAAHAAETLTICGLELESRRTAIAEDIEVARRAYLARMEREQTHGFEP